MSLDELVTAGEPPTAAAPVLCLPHQCEFLSDEWLARSRSFLEKALSGEVGKAGPIAPFRIHEHFSDAPPHLGLPDNVAAWCVDFDGRTVSVVRGNGGEQTQREPDVTVRGSYQAGLFMAQVVGALTPTTMADAMREVRQLFGDEALTVAGRLPSPRAGEIVALLHDHMARMTVENPDIAHRARAYRLERHIREVEDQGYTIIERAISDKFADAVREATLRALLPHDHFQLQWMLYHGHELERLVQNAPLMTLMDATLGRGAVIASISAIRRGPGPGTIPLHTDYSMVPEPYPEFAMTGVGVWALEDWQVDSGPTYIVPGSHRERRGPRKGEAVDRGVPIEMPKGSVVYFTHGVWHWQGDRREPGERVTIHSHFNRGILRGLEPKRVDPQMMHRNPPRLGEMLGEDDWFDKLDANGRDYLRAGHMARLQAFTDQQLRGLLST